MGVEAVKNTADELTKRRQKTETKNNKQASKAKKQTIIIIVVIMYIYHALINALSTHMIHINLNMIFYTHVEHSPTKTIYIKYY